MICTCLLARCGDGFIQNGVETCDDGNQSNRNDCPDDNTDGGTCQTAFCGDGFVRFGREDCDKGQDNSDTEPNACRTNCVEAYCRDGMIDNAESCW